MHDTVTMTMRGNTVSQAYQLCEVHVGAHFGTVVGGAVHLDPMRHQGTVVLIEDAEAAELVELLALLLDSLAVSELSWKAEHSHTSLPAILLVASAIEDMHQRGGQLRSSPTCLGLSVLSPGVMQPT